MLPAVPVQTVIDAKELDRRASFYQCALGQAVAQRWRTFVVLHGHGVEVSIVAMAEEIAAGIPRRSPSVPVEDTPIKIPQVFPLRQPQA
jgi:hypothetical protein